MTNNPFYNAVFATAYIVFVVLLLTLIQHIASGPDNILMPIGMLSLLVLSAAIMAFIFFYKPVLMLIDGKREQAVGLFLKTLGSFALIAIVLAITSVLIN